MAISMDRAKPGGLRYPILKHTQMIPATSMKEPTRASQVSPSTWRSNEYMVSRHNPIDYEILDILIHIVLILYDIGHSLHLYLVTSDSHTTPEAWETIDWGMVEHFTAPLKELRRLGLDKEALEERAERSQLPFFHWAVRGRI